MEKLLTRNAILNEIRSLLTGKRSFLRTMPTTSAWSKPKHVTRQDRLHYQTSQFRPANQSDVKFPIRNVFIWLVMFSSWQRGKKKCHQHLPFFLNKDHRVPMKPEKTGRTNSLSIIHSKLQAGNGDITCSVLYCLLTSSPVDIHVNLNSML